MWVICLRTHSFSDLLQFLQPVQQIGVAIGDQILALQAVSHLFNGPVLCNVQHVFQEVCPRFL